ncbi:palmitoyltransferase ZDHHC21-like [Saccoglossus kowalevskii]
MDSAGGFQSSNLVVSNLLVSGQKSKPNVIKLPCGLYFLKDPDLSGYYCLGFIVYGLSYGAYVLPNIVIYPMYQQGVIDVVIVSGEINNCVGEDNKWIFVLLVFYGALMSFYALILIVCHFYIFPKCQVDICNPDVFMFRHQRWFMYVGFILDLALLLICSTQFLTQVINIFLNRTTLEQIIESANYYRRMQQGQTCNHSHKSDSGRMSAFESFQEVWGSGNVLCWLNPLRRRRASPRFVYNEHVHALQHV